MTSVSLNSDSEPASPVRNGRNNFSSSSWTGSAMSGDSSTDESGSVTTPRAVNSMSRSRSESDISIISQNTNTESQTDATSDGLEVPIVGYELMEQRAKFTVFKLHVVRSPDDNWFVFRRYTDFARLNRKLKALFPSFRLSLPPKRWFGSNFDENFLEDRQLGLQAFVNNVIGHKDLIESIPVHQFLCLDDPPGPHDSLEESRAFCEALEETVYCLRKDLAEKNQEIDELKRKLTEAVAENRKFQETLSISEMP